MTIWLGRLKVLQHHIVLQVEYWRDLVSPSVLKLFFRTWDLEKLKGYVPLLSVSWLHLLEEIKKKLT